MIQKTRLMLYVNDVDTICTFWQDTFGAKTVEKNSLPDNFENIVLEITPDFELSLFQKEFIQKYSPEVSGNIPSVMFFVEDFEDVHARIDTASSIVDDNGLPAFGFFDPEGTAFAVGKLDNK